MLRIEGESCQVTPTEFEFLYYLLFRRVTSTGYLRRTAEQGVRRFAGQVEHVLAMTEDDQKLKIKFAWDSSSPASASDLSKTDHSQNPDGDSGQAVEEMLPLPVLLERNIHEGTGDVRYVLVDQDYEAVGDDVTDGSFKVDHAFLDFLSGTKTEMQQRICHIFLRDIIKENPEVSGSDCLLLRLVSAILEAASQWKIK